MKKHLSDFYNHLTSVHKTMSGRLWNHNPEDRSASRDVLAQYFESLKIEDFRKLIKDPHWNSYPSYTYYYNKLKKDNVPDPRDYFDLIFSAVEKLIFSSKKHREELIKNSNGIFRVITINTTIGKDKLRSARGALTCRDIRARKLAAALLPVGELIKHISSEKDPAIKHRIFSRVGYLNAIDETKDSRSRYIRSRAFLNDTFDPNEIREISEEIEDGKQSVYFERDVMKKFVYHITSEESVFYIDILKNMLSKDKDLKEIFMKKLTGKSYV
jgi:hypothetical protein